MKLRLDDWKKVKADKTHAIMRNKEGHEIKIALSALSPKFRGQIAALPMAEGGDIDPRQPGALNMASGGEAEDNKDQREQDQDLVDSTQDPDLARTIEKESLETEIPVKHYAGGAAPISESKDDSPEQIAADASAQAQPQAPVNIQINPTPQPAPNAQTPDSSSSASGIPASAPPLTSNTQTQQAAPPTQSPPPPVQPSSDQSSPPFPTYSPPTVSQGAQQVADLQDQQRQAYIQRHLNEKNGFANDLVNGHISPITYGQLADKSSLGRIGTMFGLMLGGIGSGITGQPNALMFMMDKEIDRDLDAQQKSKSNAQNLYNLTSQRLTDEANAGLTGATSAAQIYTSAKMQYQQLALHRMIQSIQKMPEGPTKQQAQQAIAMMSQKINEGDYQMLDKLYSMEQLSGGTSGQNTQDPESQFQAHNDALIHSGDPKLVAIGQDNRERHIPGIPGLATKAVPQATRDLLVDQNILDQKGKDLLSYIGQHKGLDWHRWSPQDRAIATQKVEEMKNFYNNSIHGGALTEGRLGWYDEQFAKHPLDIMPQLLGSTAKFREVINSNAMRRDTLLKSVGYKGYPAETNKTPIPKSGPSDGMTSKSKSGRPIVFRDGKWQYQ